ncbi:Rv3235 family protein [Frankia sp. CiP1_Cm_nod1]|uniref:Rv3235 family protein n=1 Tax=Frankia sp. CiP1_Cm_nod1 TaxID=2897160 RepID=UPI0020254DDC
MTTATTAADLAHAGSTRTRRFYQIPIAPTDPPYDDDPPAGAWGAHPPTGPAAAAPVIAAAAPIVLALPRTEHADHGDQRPYPARDTLVRPLQPLPGPGRTDAPGTGELPSARAAATVVVRAIVEAVTGIRPVAHLVAWTSPRVQADLERLVAGNVRHRRHTLRCLRVCEPREGIAEVAAVIARGDRVSAIALRMETAGSRWRVTALQTDALRHGPAGVPRAAGTAPLA